MKTFEYDISIKADNQNQADAKMTALVTILNKLQTDELLRVAQVVKNPVQLALIKSKLL